MSTMSQFILSEKRSRVTYTLTSTQPQKTSPRVMASRPHCFSY